MNQIPENTMQMLQDEALEVFRSRTKGIDFKLRTQQINWAVRKAVAHALNHALEEGIVELLQPHGGNLTYGQMREMPPSSAPTTWMSLAYEYATNGTTEAAQELAQKVLDGKR